MDASAFKRGLGVIGGVHAGGFHVGFAPQTIRA